MNHACLCSIEKAELGWFFLSVLMNLYHHTYEVLIYRSTERPLMFWPVPRWSDFQDLKGQLIHWKTLY